MPKLDVGVGDEFPAEENHQVHHHYYHFHHRRRPFRLLRVILSILLIMFVVKLTSLAWHAPWFVPHDPAMPPSLYAFGCFLTAIVVIAGVLWLLRRADKS